jgi:hypothetical protein
MAGSSARTSGDDTMREMSYLTQIQLHQQPRSDCPKYKLGTRSVYHLLYKRVVHSSDGGLYVVEASLVKQEQFVNDSGILK